MKIRRATVEDAEAITRVHVSSWQTTYRGLLPDAYLDALGHEERAHQWRIGLGRRDVAVYVAENEATGEIVGFTNAGPNRDPKDRVHPGELYAIYLLEHAKGHGVGHALFQSMREWLKRERLVPFLLWVLKDNLRARKFYAREGGRPGREQIIHIGGRAYVEVAYSYE